MNNRRRLRVGEAEISVAPPEYVILRKLEYFREGGSEKHLRDIRIMLETSGDEIDEEDLGRRAAVLGLSGIWARVRGG
jgi:hypothetical protein